MIARKELGILYTFLYFFRHISTIRYFFSSLFGFPGTFVYRGRLFSLRPHLATEPGPFLRPRGHLQTTFEDFMGISAVWFYYMEES